MADDDNYIRRCFQQLEHEGGAFWCKQPAGHSGPHDPQDLEKSKRQRLAPRRLSEDQAAEVEQNEASNAALAKKIVAASPGAAAAGGVGAKEAAKVPPIAKEPAKHATLGGKDAGGGKAGTEATKTPLALQPVDPDGWIGKAAQKTKRGARRSPNPTCAATQLLPPQTHSSPRQYLMPWTWTRVMSVRT